MESTISNSKQASSFENNADANRRATEMKLETAQLNLKTAELNAWAAEICALADTFKYMRFHQVDWKNDVSRLYIESVKIGDSNKSAFVGELFDGINGIYLLVDREKEQDIVKLERDIQAADESRREKKTMNALIDEYTSTAEKLNAWTRQLKVIAEKASHLLFARRWKKFTTHLYKELVIKQDFYKALVIKVAYDGVNRMKLLSIEDQSSSPKTSTSNFIVF